MSRGKKKEIQGRMGGGKTPLDRLKGTKCGHKCKIHNEPCTVVLRYKDKKIQETVELLRSIQGAPPHDEDSHHYCELCGLAMRENRTLDAYTRDKKGRPVLRKAGTQRFFGDEEGNLIWDGDLTEEE
jgi:hypothetical protein|tara:strand:- start:83 stop:463 length:381 start_codon:yes stop_codon:yes gene_type:complete